MSEVEIRALQPEDAGAARVVVSAQLAGTLHEMRVLEQLDIAIGGDDLECRAMVALAQHEWRVSGLAVFGAVAGAPGVVKIHALVGRDREVLRALAIAMRDSGARLVVCEIADDAPFHLTVQVLLESGYVVEGRVEDFVRDGVALLILTWRSG